MRAKERRTRARNLCDIGVSRFSEVSLLVHVVSKLNYLFRPYPIASASCDASNGQLSAANPGERHFSLNTLETTELSPAKPRSEAPCAFDHRSQP